MLLEAHPIKRHAGAYVTSTDKIARLLLLVLACAALGLAMLGEPAAANTNQGAGEPADPAVDPWAVWSTTPYDNVVLAPWGQGLYVAAVQPLNPFWCDWDAALNQIGDGGGVRTERVDFTDRGLEVLMPRPTWGEATRLASTRAFARHALGALIDAGGPFAAQLQDPATVGMELDWLAPAGRAPMEGETRECVGVLLTAAPGSTFPHPVLLAYVYAYTQAQFDARVAAITAREGGEPLQRGLIYASDVARTSSKRKDLSLMGAGVKVIGGLIARDDIVLDADAALICGDVHAGDEVDVQQMPLLIGEMMEGADVAYQTDTLSVEEARLLAQAEGIYSVEDLHFAQALPHDTVVFSEGNIVLEGTQMSGKVTLFSASGDIRIDAIESAVGAQHEGHLAVAFEGRLDVVVHDSTIDGMLRAPRKRMELVATGSTCFTHIGASSVNLTLFDSTISNGLGRVVDPVAGAQQASQGGQGELPQAAPAPEDSVPQAPEPEAAASSEDATTSSTTSESPKRTKRRRR